MGVLGNLGTAVSDWKNPFLNARVRYSALAVIIVLGAIARITMCFIGFPFELHADEMNVVEPAVDMIARDSYLTYVYFHPDHMQIKLCALLFNAYSFIRYGVDAATVGVIPAFYVIARLITALCGIAMIPLAHGLLERIKQGAGVFGAFAVAFFPAYITHSGYASPDVPLSLIVLVLIYLGVRYIENGRLGLVIALGVATAIGMTTKYPAAICCFYVAGIIAFEGFRTRGAKAVALRVLLVAAVAFVCLFAISPNLVTDLGSVLASLKNESRPNHLGADGLGFFGNLQFYATGFFSIPDATYNDTPYTNFETFIPLVIGVFCLARTKARLLLPFALCLMFWVVLSVFSLHWLRWALPMYVGPLVLAGLGLYAMVGASSVFLARDRGAFGDSKGGGFRAARVAVAGATAALAAVIALNALVSSAVLVKTAVVPQTRIEALAFCEEHNIAYENSAYDGYSPLNLRLAGHAKNAFTDATSLIPLDDGRDIEYVIISSYMYERYDPGNPEHAEALAFYDTVRNECELVHEWKATKIEQTPLGILNIAAKVGYLALPADECLAGPDNAIYRLPDQDSA
ncbi:ArnT family glycosyltransferase [Raoultibacter phocaeensis]|uniref:ArnT family glycosyltransferase n=1 Tax=Raoultibacter phocaeensis TaxID=2479841 RepID=UPI0011184694|nr:glycosyltransferase family 39 protein [Raoultibacter phocaeensis]